ncbi:MAG: response regulator transcription factor [Anaerolineae bacterium]|nr:response regulator transcription factor [Anaerolineae bacterium]
MYTDARSTPIRIVTVDNNDAVRHGLAIFAEGYDDLKLIGDACDVAEAVALCQSAAPDVVVIDPVLSGISGFAAIESIRQVCPDTPIVILSDYRPEQLVQQALQSGVSACLPKSISTDELADAIRAACKCHS